MKNFRNSVYFLLIVVVSTTLTACLGKPDKVVYSVSDGSPSPEFGGAVAAVNLAGAVKGSIQVNWSPATISVGGYRVYLVETINNSEKLTLMTEVDSNTFSYVHSDLDQNKKFSYVVRYLNEAMEEVDSNKKSSHKLYVHRNE